VRCRESDEGRISVGSIEADPLCLPIGITGHRAADDLEERDPPQDHRRSSFCFLGLRRSCGGNVVVPPPRSATATVDGLLFAARIRERLEFHWDLVLVLETVGTLHQVGDVLLEESLRARTDEAPRRLVRHAAHTDADLHATGYMACRIHQRAEWAR